MLLAGGKARKADQCEGPGKQAEEFIAIQNHELYAKICKHIEPPTGRVTFPHCL